MRRAGGRGPQQEAGVQVGGGQGAGSRSRRQEYRWEEGRGQAPGAGGRSTGDVATKLH